MTYHQRFKFVYKTQFTRQRLKRRLGSDLYTFVTLFQAIVAGVTAIVLLPLAPVVLVLRPFLLFLEILWVSWRYPELVKAASERKVHPAKMFESSRALDSCRLTSHPHSRKDGES